ncbi:hypothetical protein BRAO375_1700014 [Bradyrhizobium sp. ORS 375]|nr:hypothetical protein BRAO375_1700014 [Bradyrhizobium sp. ORS 375]
MIDEFSLDSEALASLRRAKELQGEPRMAALRDLILKHPDYTAAAIFAAVDLRRAYRSIVTGEGSPGLSSNIPARIVQFWDHEPPQDVVELMQTWKTLNPAFDLIRFDDSEATGLIERDHGDEVLSAYKRARMPAQKADIFRLAYLATHGGIYADADDRCLAPIDTFVSPRATLVVYQESYGSIGNNFIAVAPRHPVILRALRLAVTGLNRGDHDLVWLATGPGLLTRAFAQEWTEDMSEQLLARTQIMSLGALQRVIGIHCPVRYKSTDRHWSRQAFGRKKRRA